MSEKLEKQNVDTFQMLTELKTTLKNAAKPVLGLPNDRVADLRMQEGEPPLTPSKRRRFEDAFPVVGEHGLGQRDQLGGGG